MLAALKKAGRHDLIGTGPNCLVAPDKTATNSRTPVGVKGGHRPATKTKKDKFSRYSRKKK